MLISILKTIGLKKDNYLIGQKKEQKYDNQLNPRRKGLNN